MLQKMFSLNNSESYYDSYYEGTVEHAAESSLFKRNLSGVVSYPNYEQINLLEKATINIWRFGGGVLVVGGTVGNLIVLLVLCLTKLRRKATSVFLIALALSDLIALYSGAMRYWVMSFTNHYDLRETSKVLCKIHVFLTYSSLQYCSWVLLAVTIERFSSVYMPFRSKSVCNFKRIGIFLALLLLTITGINAHWFFTIGADNYQSDFLFTSNRTILFFETRVSICDYEEKHRLFAEQIYSWIDLALISLIPGSLITICNIGMTIKIVHAHIIRKRSLNTQMSQGHIENSFARMTTMTTMLMAITVTFLAATTPISIFQIMSKDMWESWAQNFDVDWALKRKLATFWFTVFNFLQYSRNATNFLLYCTSGRKFRIELKNLIRHTWKRWRYPQGIRHGYRNKPYAGRPLIIISTPTPPNEPAADARYALQELQMAEYKERNRIVDRGQLCNANGTLKQQFVVHVEEKNHQDEPLLNKNTDEKKPNTQTNRSDFTGATRQTPVN